MRKARVSGSKPDPKGREPNPDRANNSLAKLNIDPLLTNYLRGGEVMFAKPKHLISILQVFFDATNIGQFQKLFLFEFRQEGAKCAINHSPTTYSISHTRLFDNDR